LPLTFKYQDEDNDFISFSTDEELNYALKSNSGIFKVYVNWNELDVESTLSESSTTPQSYDNKVEDTNIKKSWENQRVERGRFKRERRKKEFDSRFVSHVSMDDGDKIGPNMKFEKKTWRLRNSGLKSWPVGTKLVLVSYMNEFNAPRNVEIVGECEVDKEVNVTVPMVSPALIGLYESYWKVCLPSGKKFGQRLRCQVLVSEG